MSDVVPVEFDLENLDGSQQVYILPHGFVARVLPYADILWPSFNTVLLNNLTYEDLPASAATYMTFVIGHPGMEGGIPRRPGGHGLTFGVTDIHGTEWWLTDAEGLISSADWKQNTVTPGFGDGDWLLGVRGKPREITLKGTVIGVDRASTVRSISEGGSVLTAAPRTGWLFWDDADGGKRRLPVAMTSKFKTKWLGDRYAEIEVTCKGVNLGTPGKGVFLEGESATTTVLEPGFNKFIVTGGMVPSPVRIELKGPIDTDWSLEINDFEVSLVERLAATHTLTIDTATRQVVRNGTIPARHMVSFKSDTWPMMEVGAVEIVMSPWMYEAPARTIMTSTKLW